jgi:2-polyprenyl-3-methyl-5-hydroxy-6-metoxy-1,4-benzoquinol methylase
MYQYLSQYYDLIFDFNPKTSDFMKPYITKDGNAIDLGCGTGRLTHVLYDYHMNVLGVDLDPHMIEVAKQKYPYITFKVEDMLESFSKKDMYDLVTCFGNTIVHLNPEQLDQLFFHINHKLNKNGYVVIQTLNYDHILKTKPPFLKKIEKEGLEFIRSYMYQPSQIVFKTELNLLNQHFEGSTIIYPYVIHDFIQLSYKYQLSLAIYGDMIEYLPNQIPQHIYYVFKK